MGTVSIRDLSRKTSSVIDDVVTTGRPALVTKHGKPVAAKSREFSEDLAAANAELENGSTRSSRDVFTDLDL